MFKLKFLIAFVFLLCLSKKEKLPEGFVYVDEVIPTIEVDLKYYSTDNFVGDTINGYQANRLILTLKATETLHNVQEQLLLDNKCLRVFDGYRPQRAVNHFMTWAKDLNDTINKTQFYPDIDKKQLFVEEYIATRSGHSRGSTVDLTIIDGQTNEPLDMGSSYDFFGEQSWVDYSEITEKQKSNRQLLQRVMLKNGFYNYPKEWWHFTLRNEPFPDTYFDFEVK